MIDKFYYVLLTRYNHSDISKTFLLVNLYLIKFKKLSMMDSRAPLLSKIVLLQL